MEDTNKNSEVRNGLMKAKAEIMLEELKLKYQDFTLINNDEKIINKIIEVNFNEDKIVEYFDKSVTELLQNIEDDYGILGFMDENSFRNKIIELNLNRDNIIEWIENSLSNGDL